MEVKQGFKGKVFRTPECRPDEVRSGHLLLYYSKEEAETMRNQPCYYGTACERALVFGCGLTRLSSPLLQKQTKKKQYSVCGFLRMLSNEQNTKQKQRTHTHKKEWTRRNAVPHSGFLRCNRFSCFWVFHAQIISRMIGGMSGAGQLRGIPASPKMIEGPCGKNNTDNAMLSFVFALCHRTPPPPQETPFPFSSKIINS